MSFTARHYNSIQQIFREARRTAKETHSRGQMTDDHRTGAMQALNTLQESIGRMLAADNPRFDLARYNIECEREDRK